MLDRLQKILKWFTLQPDVRLEAFYFSKDEEDNDIFYPWGQPGESYHIDKSQKKKIKLFVYSMVFLLLAPPAVLFLYFSYNSSHLRGTYHSPSWTVVAPITSYLFIHFSLTYGLIKNLKPHRQICLPVGRIKNPPALIQKLFCLAVGQIFFLILNFADYTVEACLFVIPLYSLLILIVWVRRGFFFQKK